MKKKVTYVLLLVLVLVIILGAILLNLNSPYKKASDLIDAIKAQDTALVMQLLSEGVDPNQTNIPPSNVWSFWEMSADRPICYACYSGNLDLIKLLIDHGPSVDYQENTGWSPLRETLLQTNPNDLEMVQLLLSNGADPTIVESGENAIFAAALMYPVMFGEEEYATGYDENAAEMITNIVDLLLSDGDVNSLSPYGNTLLMHAAQRGNLKLIHYLIECGCCLSTRNNQGKTAYDIAIECNNKGAAELLKTNE